MGIRAQWPEGAVLVATRSAAKLRELRPMFAAAGFEALDLTAVGIAETSDEDALESGRAFEDNAFAKARHFQQVSGMATVSDDSGIEVVALGGAPGVYSKRWSARSDLSGQALDDANNTLLLERATRAQ